MSNSEICDEETEVIPVFQQDNFDEDSVDPPPEEWSSLLVVNEENPKLLQYEEGTFHPGSGEICTKYITMSASSVLHHVYYCYPGVIDPGITEALFQPIPKVIYPEDGQELYLAMCKEINTHHISSFYRQLLEKSVDLGYYGVDEKNFIAIAAALKFNRFVTRLNLTENFMKVDACYHLGDMLSTNCTLVELDLSGCRIGPQGAKHLFVSLHLNSTLVKLNISGNEIEDKGVAYLADSIFKGTGIREVNISRNNVSGVGVMALVQVFETFNKLTHLDFSWNNIKSANAVCNLCSQLSQNQAFKELKFSWNALEGEIVGKGIKQLMKSPSIRLIDLSNNKLCGKATITTIGENLEKALALKTLNLSSNPLSPEDAVDILNFMKKRTVKLRNLLLDNVAVNHKFINLRDQILSLDFRKNAVITCGYIRTQFIPTEIDMKNLLLSRAEAICKTVKRQKPNIAVIILQLCKDYGGFMGVKDFAKETRRQGASLDEPLVDQLGRLFPGPKDEKIAYISLDGLKEYVKRKWPDTKLPPTPPPTIPEPKPAPKGKAK
ncbi:hypothetical protein MSG28_003165 [Choristoneura fumiferana]|uniref:Uncharacterized protein n=1 Tax=Choristoneura fumiferana TaxID=7141 RepID=A0ACC0KDN0_CHOFU|nr:hypothetical protein MSG28_003165 [Choristoneura fumiferana]